jgi:hypothetical protein
MISRNSDPRSGNVVTAPITRIIPELEGGGWLVITHRGHAWLHGDRQAAIEDKRWLDNQWRGQR